MRPRSARNSGLVVKDAGTATTFINFAIANSGEVRAQTGTLSFGRGTAQVAVDGGAWKSAGGTVSLDGGDFQLGNSVDFRATVGGGRILTAGFASSSVVQLSGGSLSPTGSMTVPTLIIEGGDLFGPGDVHISGALTWSKGAVNAGATLIVDDGATGGLGATPSPGMPFLIGRLVNRGSLTLTLTGNVQNLGSGAVFENRGTFRANAPATMYPYSNPPAQLFNSGLIVKDAGTATTFINFAIANSGEVRAQTGKLSIGRGTAQVVVDGGVWKSAGGTVSLDAGVFDVGGDADLSASINGATVSARNLRAQGTLRVSSGSLALSSTTQPFQGGRAGHVGRIADGGRHAGDLGEFDVVGRDDERCGQDAGDAQCYGDGHRWCAVTPVGEPRRHDADQQP